ncbi:MAG: dipeptidase [Ginsengibacter sp.]
MATRRKFIEYAIAGGLGGIVTSGSAPSYIKDLGLNKSTVSLEEAQDLHNECLIFDAHNDTTVERVARGQNVSTLLQLDEAYQIDIPRMNIGGYNAGTFTVGNGVIANVWVTLEKTLSMIESNPEKVLLVRSSKDVVRAKETGKVGILPGIEGIAKWVMGETDILRMLYRNGVKWVSISHGEGGKPAEEVPGGHTKSDGSGARYKNMRTGVTYLQGSHTVAKLCTLQERAEELKKTIGLTSFGKEVLKVSNELGIVTDLAHINDRAFFDVIEHTTKPAAVSHTGVFSVCNHSRNMTDDQIKALASNGGVMGIFLVSHFLAEDPKKATVATLIKHISYVTNLVGIDHVGIGSDVDGGADMVLPDLSKLVKITQAMMESGFTKDEIKKVWGGNFLRVLEQNID